MPGNEPAALLRVGMRNELKQIAVPPSWDGAGAPGGPPKAEPSAGSAGPGARAAAPLDSILKGVAGQVGGLLWDVPERDSAADDDDGEGTGGVLAPA